MGLANVSSPLTRERAKPAVYFGGPYRIIDFVLSNCINSGLRRVFIATQYKSLSLNRHVRQGWSIVSEELGEFVEILPPQKRVGEQWYQGTADAVYQNLYSIVREEPRYVVVLAGDHVYKMDYLRMVRFHQEKDATVTLAAIEVPVEDGRRFGIVAVDERDCVTGFLEKPRDPPSMPGHPHLALASMGIYVFNSDVLVRALDADAADPHSQHDFGRNIIPSLIPGGRIYAYHFYDENKKAAKYWRDIGTLDAYFEANMDLCQVNPEFNLYDPEWPLRTYMQQAPPAKFVFAEDWRRGEAQDSLISHGCIVSGSRIHGQHPLPERARPQLLRDRVLDPDAGGAGGPACAHSACDHRSRRAHPARRAHRVRSRRGSPPSHRQRRGRGRRRRRRGTADRPNRRRGVTAGGGSGSARQLSGGAETRRAR